MSPLRDWNFARCFTFSNALEKPNDEPKSRKTDNSIESEEDNKKRLRSWSGVKISECCEYCVETMKLQIRRSEKWSKWLISLRMCFWTNTVNNSIKNFWNSSYQTWANFSIRSLTWRNLYYKIYCHNSWQIPLQEVSTSESKYWDLVYR